jgi:hypothetical protein
LGEETDRQTDLPQALEDFLVICTAVLSERTFVTDYHARFSVRDDFDLFEQVGLRADPTRKHYILDALNTGQQQQQAEGERVKNGVEKCEPRGAAAVPMAVSSRQALYLFIYLFWRARV